jgi:hypothetical protein
MDLIGMIMPREAESLRLPRNIRALSSGDTPKGILTGTVVAYPDTHTVGPYTAEVRLICANGKVCETTTSNFTSGFQFAVNSPETFTIRIRAKGFYSAEWPGFKIYPGLETTCETFYLDPLPKGFFARWFRKRPLRLSNNPRRYQFSEGISA